MNQYKWCFIIIGLFYVSSVSGAMQGKVWGNTYLAPGNAFKMEIPNRYNVKQQIKESVGEGITTVGFRNDYGNNINVQVIDFPQDFTQEIKRAENKDKFIAVISEIIAASDESWDGPKPEVLNVESFFDEKLGNAYFYVRKVPGGSGLVAVEHGKELDSKIGFLYTVSDHYIVLVMMQESPVEDYIAQLVESHAKQGTGKNATDDLRNRLLGVRRSITFMSKAKA